MSDEFDEVDPIDVLEKWIATRVRNPAIRALLPGGVHMFQAYPEVKGIYAVVSSLEPEPFFTFGRDPQLYNLNVNVTVHANGKDRDALSAAAAALHKALNQSPPTYLPDGSAFQSIRRSTYSSSFVQNRMSTPQFRSMNYKIVLIPAAR